jgi:hypothetical protein
MSVTINKWAYRLQYNNYFGGVTAISKDQAKQKIMFSHSNYVDNVQKVGLISKDFEQNLN